MNRRGENECEDLKKAFESIAECLSCGVLLHKSELILHSSPALTGLFGYEPEEMAGKPLLDLFARRCHQAVAAAMAPDEKLRRFEAEGLKSDGSVFPLEVCIVPVSYRGRVCRVTSAKDISERKMREEEISRREERFRDVALCSNDWAWEVDARGVYTYCSDRGFELMGYEPGEIIGKTPFDFMPERERERFREIFSALRDNCQPIKDLENINLTRDGREVVLLTNGVPVFSGGVLAGYRGVDKDITERKLHEEELKRINDELDSFAHAVSHDLRSPMAGVVTGLDTLVEILETSGGFEGFDDVFGLVNSTRNLASRAGALVERMFSLAEAAQVPDEVNYVNISEVVAGVIQECAGYALSRRIRISVDDLGMVRGDSTQIYQVFANLVSNALRHSGGSLVEVRKLGDNRFSVRDNGRGIPEGILSRNYGMGISIVKKLLDLYDGSIAAYNDNGAVFEFTLSDLEKGHRDG